MDPLKVILVDDEEEFVNTIVERMRMRDIDADGAINGMDALSLMNAKKYNVAVVDYKMPGLSGHELMRQMTTKYPDIKVILITGHGFLPEDEDDIKDVGEYYLVKPFSLDLLIRMMEDIRQSED